MSGLHELDPGSALLYAFRSGGRRLLLFFACGAFSASIAVFCRRVSTTLQSLSEGRIFDVLGNGLEELLWSPLVWIGCIVEVGSQSAAAILILPVLGTALLLILFSERHILHGVFLIIFAQPIQTFIALEPRNVISRLALGVYLLAIAVLFRRRVMNIRALSE